MLFIQRIAQEMAVADHEDDLFDSGFFSTDLIPMSGSKHPLSWNVPDVPVPAPDNDDPHLNLNLNSNDLNGQNKEKRLRDEWKASYAHKLGRKVRAAALTRDDNDNDPPMTTAFSKKNLSKKSKSLSHTLTRKNTQESEESEEEKVLDEQIWSFSRGALAVGSLPYEGTLSGDEDGDF